MKLWIAKTYKLPLDVVALIEQKAEQLSISHKDLICLLVRDQTRNLNSPAQQIQKLEQLVLTREEGQILDGLIRTIGHDLADKLDYLIESQQKGSSPSTQPISQALLERQARVEELEAQIAGLKANAETEIKKHLFKMKFLVTEQLQADQQPAVSVQENRLSYHSAKIDEWYANFDFEQFFKEYQVSPKIARALRNGEQP